MEKYIPDEVLKELLEEGIISEEEYIEEYTTR